MLKILHINTNDISGGAAKAAYRLHRGLLKIGVDSKYLVANKLSDDFTILGPDSKLEKTLVKFYPYLDALPLLRYPKRNNFPFACAWIPGKTLQRIKKIDVDLVHLHWIAGGFLRIENLANIKRPLVWTLHDSWPFTGGCHIPFECDRYLNDCGNCPILQSGAKQDLSSKILARKKKYWENLDITVVAPSRWLAASAKSSSLFHDKTIHIIPHGLDIQRFKPADKQFARRSLMLHPERKMILFGAYGAIKDKNKGYHLFTDALKLLLHKFGRDKIEVIIFGVSAPAEPQDLGFPVNYMGYLRDDISIALLYAACDVMVVPSIQEAFGQTASEAMACGCPVVAFRTSGLIDIVDHERNGYLAKPFDSADLANGISWVIGDSQRQEQLSQEARSKAVREFELQIIAKRYLNLYEDILGTKDRKQF